MGLDGGAYLASSNPVERLQMLARAQVIEDARETEQNNLAVKIIERLGEALP